MILKIIDGQWWIIDRVYGIGSHGPYKTKQAADEDRRGLRRTIAANPDIFKCRECGGTKQEEHLPGKYRTCQLCKEK